MGSEYEENLSLRYLASALEAKGVRAQLVPFNEAGQLDTVVRAALAHRPVAVGISVPFQLRARELLAVATALRARGYDGHICVGGHFATFEYESILRDFPAVDSVVRHEGEDTLVELRSRLLRWTRRSPRFRAW